MITATDIVNLLTASKIPRHSAARERYRLTLTTLSRYQQAGTYDRDAAKRLIRCNVRDATKLLGGASASVQHAAIERIASMVEQGSN